jgi:uncharacterized membrane protein
MQLIRALSPVPFFMVWNSVLAAVPLVLACALFRRGVSTGGAIWWIGVVAFVVTLPNAPYVLTDLVHLVEVAHHGVLLRTAIAYAAFVSFGMVAYTVAVARFTRHLRRLGVSLGAALAAEVALHGVVAVGVLIGRYGRWNSWDLGLRPVSVVADSLGARGAGAGRDARRVTTAPTPAGTVGGHDAPRAAAGVADAREALARSPEG